MSETPEQRKARVLAEKPSPEALARAKERIYAPQVGTEPPTPAQTTKTAETLRAMRQRLENFAAKLPSAVMPHDALRQKKKQQDDLDKIEK